MRNLAIWDAACKAMGVCTDTPPTIDGWSYAMALQKFYDSVEVLSQEGNVSGRVAEMLAQMVLSSYLCGYRMAQISAIVRS